MVKVSVLVKVVGGVSCSWVVSAVLGWSQLVSAVAEWSQLFSDGISCSWMVGDCRACAGAEFRVRILSRALFFVFFSLGSASFFGVWILAGVCTTGLLVGRELLEVISGTYYFQFLELGRGA